MTVFFQVFSLFLIMAAGWAFARKGYLGRETVRGISSLILKLSMPCLILVSLQKPFSPELLSVSIATIVAATVFYGVTIALGYLAVALLRTPVRQRGVFAFALAFSNCGFIGFPVVASILGQDAIFIVAIHNILFNLLVFSAGVLMVSRGEKGENADSEGVVVPGRTRRGLPISQIFNLNVLATVAGFVLFVSSVSIPRILLIPMESLGSLTTPLAMIVTGALLARTPVKAAIGDWRVFAVSFLRLAGFPFIAALALRQFGIGGDLRVISIILAGMPAASNTGIIAEVYGGDTETASSVVFLSTLLSVVSIPVLALLIG